MLPDPRCPSPRPSRGETHRASNDPVKRTLGGADRVRTDDLRLARAALSQLSYSPSSSAFLIMVGLGRFELPTSRLSGVRSNQLSYRPKGGGSRRHLRSHGNTPIPWKLNRGKRGQLLLIDLVASPASLVRGLP